jgi:CRP/FNR family transcriptional regulator, cyclic AMP receptor protein
MKAEDTAALLGSSALLSGLEPEGVLALAEAARQRIYPKDHFVFQQGEPGDALFVLLSGSVHVIAGEEGEEWVVATLRPPDVFGEVALLDGGRRSASVQALESTRVLAVDRRAVLELVAAHPGAADGLLRSFGALVRQKVSQAADVAFLDLHGRAAERLARLMEGEADGASEARIGLNHVQSEIAAAVGGSRRSANEILGFFLERRILELDGRSVVVRNLRALRTMATERP